VTDPPRHPLRALLVAQFLGAFNDNAWKLIVTLLAIAAATTGLSGAEAEAAAHHETSLAFVVFLLPMLAVSLPAGAIADRVSKRTVILGTKVLEVVLMAAATAVLLFRPGDRDLALVVVALMGVQSGLFSPAKYGILPEVLPHDRLSAGNGQLEMWTFLAIVLGTAAGGLMLQATGAAPWAAAAVLLVFAAAGLVAARGVPQVTAARAEGGVIATARDGWNAVRGERAIWLSILGLALFWAVASALGQNVLVYAKLALGLSDATAGLPMAAVGVGIGAGGIAAGRLSNGKIEMGLVPLGSVGMAVFATWLGLSTPAFWGTLALMAALGMSAGLLLVPLNALLQWRAPEDRRGSVIALSNVLVGLGMLGGTWAGGFLTSIGASVDHILLAIAAVTVLGTGWALYMLPEAFLRLGLVIATNTLYRLRIVGGNRVPSRGGVLLAPNHVSYMDGLFVIAATDRPVRFLIDADIFEHPLLRPFMRMMGGIPVSPKLGQEEILRALRAAGDALDRGEVVCIFPEGQITRTGSLLQFRRGLERIAGGRDAQIVPVHLDRVWGSVFSREGGRFFFKLPKRVPYPVTVAFGPPLPADAAANEVRGAVADLGAEAWELRKQDRTTLHRRAIRVLRRVPWRFQFGDAARPRLSRFGTLAGAIALGQALRKDWDGQERVGVLLPPSVAGALVNVAASMAGKVVVNLNYTLGTAGMEVVARKAGLRSVVTAKVFLAKADLIPPAHLRVVHLEDVKDAISAAGRLRAALLALLAPVRLIERACGNLRPQGVEDVATIVFSSGSTGEPKGVPLTHFNLNANVEGIAQVFRPERDDRLLGILPLFHAFGTMATWFALNRGMGVAFQPNPLDAQAVGKMVSKYRVTLLLATPTLLALYTRACKPTQFGSLRVVLGGAEKLTEEVADAFEDRFGIRPLEGYGCTECSPAIAVGTPDFRAPGFYQPGHRRGYIGQPLPGLALRIVDPLTRESLPAGRDGLVLVRGPSVFSGYLDDAERTSAAFHEGWYVTGDIGHVDADGYLAITDRASRFAKIGGEMVPCGTVERALHAAADAPGGTFAVTFVVDPSRGERLVVVHAWDGEVEELLATARTEGLPNLFTPKARDFVHVDALPLLGTGKLDLLGVKRIAQETRGEEAT
jgi:acyl-[acyl-carrier-protein]-phospholipid O-acyltransferase/long-chain-fatty-acid--[acyl-carrier-protein] ligase